MDAGVNLDGALLYANTGEPDRLRGSRHPTAQRAQLASRREPRRPGQVLAAYFATPRSWSKVYALRDTGHFSFTDAEHYVPQAIPDPPGMDAPAGFSLGTAPRQEVVDTTNHLVAGMFDRFLKEAPAPNSTTLPTRIPAGLEVR